ncbi:MAG: hypothetical protein ACLPV8_25460 [Steroidobacteraceae bacterium]
MTKARKSKPSKERATRANDPMPAMDDPLVSLDLERLRKLHEKIDRANGYAPMTEPDAVQAALDHGIWSDGRPPRGGRYRPPYSIT